MRVRSLSHGIRAAHFFFLFLRFPSFAYESFCAAILFPCVVVQLLSAQAVHESVHGRRNLFKPCKCGLDSVHANFSAMHRAGVLPDLLRLLA